MGLFGSSNKDDTRAKIEELKAKMQGGQQPQGQQQQPPQQQAWQQQPSQEQGWQPPREQDAPAPSQQQPPAQPQQRSAPSISSSKKHTHETDGILLELGEGMSLNLPIKEKMRLDEFLRVADRVRELKKIDHS